MEEENRVECRAIIEVLGAPKEHVVASMKKYTDKIKAEKDYEITKITISKPKKEDNMFAIFADMEININGVANCAWFCFDYMPSSFEVIKPDSLKYHKDDFVDFINDLIARLHDLDMMLKNFKAENDVIKNNGVQLMRNMLVICMKDGPKSLTDLVQVSGIDKGTVQKFLEIMVKDKKIKLEQDKYSIL